MNNIITKSSILQNNEALLDLIVKKKKLHTQGRSDILLHEISAPKFLHAICRFRQLEGFWRTTEYSENGVSYTEHQ